MLMKSNACGKIIVIVSIVVFCQIEANLASNCATEEKYFSYLDIAVDMISKAKTYFPTCSSSEGNVSVKFMDCSDVLSSGYNKSGIYRVWPKSRVLGDRHLDVYCDMGTDGGGWTVIQRRGNFSTPNDFFFKNWESYKVGFGDIDQDFWLGNDNIFALTNQKAVSIRFDLKDVEQEKRYAVYDSFWTDDENNNYTLHIGGYIGNAGDSMADHNGHKFTTKDLDNDRQDGNCAKVYKGGWWYSNCHHANLNGLNLRGKHESYADGIEWHTWKGYQESLDTTEMKIRPKIIRKITAINTPKF